jgi:ribosome-associated toxin RatA of RatAB toxin-antitoxin module
MGDHLVTFDHLSHKQTMRQADYQDRWSRNLIDINLSHEVHARLDRVWSIIADVDKEPYFWPSRNTVNNISKNGNVIEREITVGFKNSKSCQTVVLNPRKSVEVLITRGPVRGIRSITLNSSAQNNNATMINISWNIDLSSIPISDRTYVRNNIEKETTEALNRLAEVAE